MQSITARDAAARRKSRREAPRPIAVPVNEACAIGGFGRTVAYALMAEGRLASTKVRGRRLVFVSSIENVLREGAD